jgi:hypothetical protein
MIHCKENPSCQDNTPKRQRGATPCPALPCSQPTLTRMTHVCPSDIWMETAVRLPTSASPPSKTGGKLSPMSAHAAEEVSVSKRSPACRYSGLHPRLQTCKEASSPGSPLTAVKSAYRRFVALPESAGVVGTPALDVAGVLQHKASRISTTALQPHLKMEQAGREGNHHATPWLLTRITQVKDDAAAM